MTNVDPEVRQALLIKAAEIRAALHRASGHGRYPMTKVDPEVRQALLINAAEIRAALYDIESDKPLATRAHRLCDALSAWASLPRSAARYYASAVLEALFDVVADSEEDDGLSDIDRMVVEVSLWDVAVEVRLVDEDPDRAAFVSRRRTLLSESLEKRASNDVEKLLYKWTRLLRGRPGPIPALPGPFREDVEAVTHALLDAGLPRRAKVLADKFQIPVPPLVRWTIDHRPPSEEADRTRKLLANLAVPSRPVAYGVLVTGRALQQVLSASLEAIPMAVGSSGVITIDREAYGALIRR